MQLDGVTLSGVDEVRALLESRRALQARDEHPWDWVARFADQAGSEQLGWLDQALVAVLQARRGDDGLRPIGSFDEIMTAAERGGSAGVGQALRAQLLDDLEGWSDPERSALFGWVMRLRLEGQLSDLEQTQLAEAVCGPASLNMALHVLGDVAPAGALLLVQRWLSQVEPSPRLLRTLGWLFWLEPMASLRPALGQSLAVLQGEQRKAVVSHLFQWTQRTRDEAQAQALVEQLLVAWELGQLGVDAEAAKDLVRRFWLAVNAGQTDDVAAMLVSPKDGAALGPVFAEYAQMVQDGAQAYVDKEKGRSALMTVEEPASLGPSPMPGVALVKVPATLKGGRDGGLVVYQLGDALRVGLMVGGSADD